ncbi:MAG: class II fumarate hydratase [Planctomycetota bacterium]|nr:class II fumarate hydratase [Planctomycetota bacterium]
MSETRTEKDSMGEVELPAEVVYGAHTARAAANFRISGWRMPRGFIAALGLIKRAAAGAHKEAGRLDAKKADAVIAAAQEVIDGRLDGQFVVDVFQTGSGTSTNMNANEVIANRASQILGGRAGDKTLVHPNDDVNMGQSSNDVIPTTIHVAAARQVHDKLLPALQQLQDALRQKADEFDGVVKVGRTHMMDAVPIRLGQEFAGYAAQIEGAVRRLEQGCRELLALAVGGTAIGTGLNAPEGFADDVCRILSAETGLAFHRTQNHFAEQGAKDAVLFASGAMRNAAIAMGKIASDLRLLGSGPRCGLGELVLPAVQPGSSIMPGKVNPVICESVIQVACQVVGCDAAIAAGAAGGVGSILQLNVAMPMIAWNLLTSIRLLANAADVFELKCIRGLTPNEDRCRELLERSLATVTALAPRLGYDTAAEIAKTAYATGRTIREICLEKNLLPEKELDDLLDVRRQTGR